MPIAPRALAAQPARSIMAVPVHQAHRSWEPVRGEKTLAVFRDAEQLYTVLQGVFTALVERGADIEAFTHSNLVVRMTFSAPDAEILLDGRQPPLEVFYGTRPGQANLEFAMPADLLHAIWLGRESTSQAFFSGRIRTRGNLLAASRLLDLFRQCEQVYPEVAAAHGLV